MRPGLVTLSVPFGTSGVTTHNRSLSAFRTRSKSPCLPRTCEGPVFQWPMRLQICQVSAESACRCPRCHQMSLVLNFRPPPLHHNQHQRLDLWILSAGTLTPFLHIAPAQRCTKPVPGRRAIGRRIVAAGRVGRSRYNTLRAKWDTPYTFSVFRASRAVLMRKAYGASYTSLLVFRVAFRVARPERA
jgi:hypothetical protein